MTAPFLWRDLLRGVRSRAPAPLPPKKRCKKIFPIFLSKTPFPAFLRLEKRCEDMLYNLEFILFLGQEPKNNNLIKKDSSINNSYLSFLCISPPVNLIKQCSLKESSKMSFYKGFAYLVNLESLREMHSNDSEI